jgi:nicotinamide-nucleotide amidase
MRVELISIGDELLLGYTQNTNATWMCEQLVTVGLQANWITAVGDVEADIVEALKNASTRADIILVTGGLGPTHDDVTKNASCRFFESSLGLDERVLNQIKERFRRRGIPMASVNKVQAMVPDKAEIIENSQGTAPGMIFRAGTRHYYFMPGVPHEMQGMMMERILPELAQKNDQQIIMCRFFYTSGIPESTLYEKIGDIQEIQKYVRVAFLPGLGGVKIRLLAKAATRTEAMQMLDTSEKIIKPRISSYVYSQEYELLEKVVASLLADNKKTLAVAESCTGGLICHKLTGIPGSSQFFERGIVAYSNEAKYDLLGVQMNMIREHGAVSPEVACEMAAGVRRAAQSDYGLSTTGIAGPAGGTPKKPVGLVYIGYSDCNETIYEKHVYLVDRMGNKERAAQAALNLLRKKIQKEC